MIARLSALTAMVAAVAWTYFPAAGFAFLNWDDQSVILRNPSLGFPGVARWAWITTYMEHYQPLSWLAWAAIKAGFGPDASAFHVANIAAHVVCVLLVYAAARVVLTRAVPEASATLRNGAAVAAALLFGLHPLRVEVVAWISAMPYALALAFLLASLVAYLRTAARTPTRLPVAALVLYAASLAARPVALGFPAVLVVLDVWLLKRRTRTSLSVAWPFAVLAVAAAGIESVARTSGINDAPWLYRVQSAASAPFVYLWHTIAPVSLTPLDVLPIDPVANPGVAAAALLALAGVCLAAWIWRHRWPALAAAWAAYLALLAPAAGLVPSGLQATADRYTYLPGVVVAIAVAVAAAQWASARKGRITSAAVVVLVLLAAEAVTRATRAHAVVRFRVVVVPRRRSGSSERCRAVQPRSGPGRRGAQRGGGGAVSTGPRAAARPRGREGEPGSTRCRASRTRGERSGSKGRPCHGVGALPAGHRSRSAAHPFAGGSGHGARHPRPRG